jgi:hypothetical protein
MLKKIGSILLLLMIGLTCWAEPALTLRVLTESFVAGRPFQAQLLVNGTDCSDPEWNPSGFNVIAQNHQTAGSDTNLTHLFSFKLIPLRAGRMLLPVFSITCDDTDLESEPEVITVQKPLESDELTLSTALSQSEVFVGQPVQFTADWRVTFNPSWLRAVSMIHPTQNLPSLRVFDQTPAANEIGLPVDNRRLMAEQIKDATSTVYRVRQTLIPQEEGTLNLPPIYLICSRMQSAAGATYQNVPSYFDNQFFTEVGASEGFVEYYAESKPLELTVKPLPPNETGLPFSGIVGACELSVTIATNVVKVGEPIALTIRLQSDTPQAVELPDLRSFDALQRRFWIPETQSSGRCERDARIYAQLVRPLHVGVQMVPPLDLLIFNPETAQYEQITSPAIPLQVQPNEGATRFTPPVQGNDLKERTVNMEGIWFNKELAANGLDQAISWAFDYWYIWLLAPVLIGLMLEPAARRRRLYLTDPKRAIALRAYPRFRRRQQREPLEPVLQDYLAERFGLQSGTITRGDLRPILADLPVSTETARQLTGLMNEIDQARFGRSGEQKARRESAATIIRKLESEVSQ